jgi:hypothetical protein
MRKEPFRRQVAAGAAGFCALGTCNSIWSKAQESSTPPESLESSEAAVSAQLGAFCEEESAMRRNRRIRVRNKARHAGMVAKRAIWGTVLIAFESYYLTGANTILRV